MFSVSFKEIPYRGCQGGGRGGVGECRFFPFFIFRPLFLPLYLFHLLPPIPENIEVPETQRVIVA